jgi:protein SCO1/2
MTFEISRSTQTAVSNHWKFAGRKLPIIGKFVAIAAAVVVAALPSFAQTASDIAGNLAAQKLQHAGFEQNLGTQIPTELSFTDENGQPVTLAKYFNKGRPVILTLNYFGCPMLCTMILNGVVECAKKVPFKVGREYEIVTVSFDPRDTAKLAAKKKENYLTALGQPDAATGWHFLTGKKDQIDALCKAAGFSYFFDEKTQEFGHGSGIMVSTPQGKLSHYFYGIDYESSDVRLALVEASQGKIGTLADKAKLLFCYHYDPVSGKYTASINRFIQLGCGLTIAAVATFLVIQFRREFRQPRKAAV